MEILQNAGLLGSQIARFPRDHNLKLRKAQGDLLVDPKA